MSEKQHGKWAQKRRKPSNGPKREGVTKRQGSFWNLKKK